MLSSLNISLYGCWKQQASMMGGCLHSVNHLSVNQSAVSVVLHPPRLQ